MAVEKLHLITRETSKGTRCIEGSKIQKIGLDLIRERFDLSRYTLVLHSIRNPVPSAHDMASEQWLHQTERLARQLNMRCWQVEHPSAIDASSFARQIDQANRSSEIVGIILQFPLPKHLHGVLSALDPTKDIDALNPTNRYWQRHAMAELALRLICAVPNASDTIAVLGSDNFIGNDIAVGASSHGVVFRLSDINTINPPIVAQTMISALNKANSVGAEHIGTGIVLGIDVGRQKVGDRVFGDFNLLSGHPNSVDGHIHMLTPVPGGVAPLSLLIYAERIVQNVYGSNALRIEFQS